ncbi:MAG: galactose-1-phosphate uridylyltransferase [Betaproteobacteria bacterium]
MPELRQDPITGTWVVIATERAKRPSDFKRPAEQRKGPESCPFCYGHEAMTPPEIMAYRPSGGRDKPGWSVRVVPNKFPALAIEEQPAAMNLGNDFYHWQAGYGAHEVIIESPEHDSDLSTHSVDQLCSVLRALRDRFADLRRDKNLRYIQIFKNHGATAGASLEHPHFQLIATPVIPTVIAQELEGALRYYERQGECIYCNLLKREFLDGERLVEENQGFVAFCPYSSRSPFETWILPRDHHSDFDALTDQQMESLARLLKETFIRFLGSLDHPPFNLVLHTAPVDLEAAEYYHWHLEIIPRLTIYAGFELGTGIYINPTPPETAAQFLQVSLSEIH